MIGVMSACRNLYSMAMVELRISLRNWKVLAPGLLALSTATILLAICTLEMPASSAPSPLPPDCSLDSPQIGGCYYYQSRQRSSRRVLDEYPRSQPAPRSYPPPAGNVQTSAAADELAPISAASPPPHP